LTPLTYSALQPRLDWNLRTTYTLRDQSHEHSLIVRASQQYP